MRILTVSILALGLIFTSCVVKNRPVKLLASTPSPVVSTQTKEVEPRIQSIKGVLEEPLTPEEEIDVAELIKEIETVLETIEPRDKAQNYLLTPNSEVKWVARKLFGKHRGGFKKVTGSFSLLDDKLLPTKKPIKIDLNSIWSDDKKLTAHLKTADFFETSKYPESTFQVTSVDFKQPALAKVLGILNLHGVSQEISIPVKVTKADNSLKLEAKFAINREDFNIRPKGFKNAIINKKIIVSFAIEAKLK